MSDTKTTDPTSFLDGDRHPVPLLLGIAPVKLPHMSINWGADNPLLSQPGLPDFASLNLADALKAIRYMIRENRKATEQILAQAGDNPTWEKTLKPLEFIGSQMSKLFLVILQLSAVVDSPKLRKLMEAANPAISRFGTEMGQHQGLYKAFKHVRESDEFAGLGVAEKKIIENALLDFRLSGIELSQADQKRFGEISEKLAKNHVLFAKNLVDATKAGALHISDAAELKGIPEAHTTRAKKIAESVLQDGYILSLDQPTYQAVLTYCESRALRERMYRAYTTRAAAVDGACAFDNTPVMVETLKLRLELAKLLSYDNYAEYALVKRMAKEPTAVLTLLTDMSVRTRPTALKDYKELSDYARENFGAVVDESSKLAAWDILFYAEKMRIEKYQISQEALRQYFPVPRVLTGLIEIVRRLYKIEIRERTDVSVWHKDVRYFELFDAKGTKRAAFYLDLFAREGKQQGGWHLNMVSRQKNADGSVEMPVSVITCNFTPPEEGKPGLLTHQEVTVLAHELGHALHSLLTLVDYPSLAGTNVQRDGVELPSQLMENWCWQKEGLELLSGQYETGEPLSEEMIGKMLAAKNFQASLAMARMLEFALFDFRLHMHRGDFDGAVIQQYLNEARAEAAVVIPPSYNRFQNGFAHIFEGGYAAGYYSYLWAEVLSADAFSIFEQNGIFDSVTAERFLHAVLEQGGVRDMMELYVEFCGREPTADALLRHRGL